MKKGKELSAQARTVSLFTGKTDQEDQNARDGSEPIEVRGELGDTKLKWTGGVSSWWVDDRKGGQVYRILKDKGGFYTAHSYGERLGTFATLFEATDACEAHRRRPRVSVMGGV